MEIKDLLLKTLSAFISFCEENHLTYYAGYGTVLGAVRHNGFIPWDDDIDVHMPRADYQRLWEIRNQIPPPYQVADISELGYTAPFMKFMDMSTSIWEFERKPYMLGVYIDIFPLDECPEDVSYPAALKKQFDSAFFSYFRTLEQWSVRELGSFLIHGYWGEFKNIFVMKYNSLLKKRKFHRRVLTLLDELSSLGKGSFYLSSTDVYMDFSVFKKEWFDYPIDVPFENRTIKIPNGYDAYLRLLYGDYMQLPPEDEQVSHHSHYFVCLDKGVTIKEARNMMRRKES